MFNTTFPTIQTLDKHYRDQWNGTIRDQENGVITINDRDAYLDSIAMEWNFNLALTFQAIVAGIIGVSS